MQRNDEAKAFAALWKSNTDAALRKAYPAGAENNPYERSYDAMEYILFLGGGGSRWRTSAVMAGCASCLGECERAVEYAIGIEEIHSYTLILDDIQDKDVERRGKPACHVAFGVDTAMMAAGRLFARGIGPFQKFVHWADIVRDILDRLHRGQCADLAFDKHGNLTPEQYRFIASGKTSALFQLAFLGGAVAADATDQKVAALVAFGEHFGLAFQAIDDLEDYRSAERRDGESYGSHPRPINIVDAFANRADAEAEIKRTLDAGSRILDGQFGAEADILRSFLSLMRGRMELARR